MATENEAAKPTLELQNVRKTFPVNALASESRMRPMKQFKRPPIPPEKVQEEQ